MDESYKLLHIHVQTVEL